MKLNLKEIRKNRKMTQQELAQSVGATKRQIGAWERGENDIPMDYASMIADVLKCTVDDIAGRTVPAAKNDDSEEQELVGIYRSLNAHGRAQLMVFARGCAASYPLNQADAMGA